MKRALGAALLALSLFLGSPATAAIASGIGSFSPLNVAPQLDPRVPGGTFAVSPATWTPASLGSALECWWDADDHGTANMTDDGGGLISMWKDRVGGVATTATTTARATWTSTAINSAYSGLTFDGVANAYVNTAYTACPTGATAGEIWVLGTQTAASSDATQRVFIRMGTAGAASREIVRVPVGASPINRARVTDASSTLTDTNTDLTGNMVVGGQWGGTMQGGFVNGSAFNPATGTIVSLNTGTGRMRIGANSGSSAANFWQGVIRMVIITTALTPTQEQQLMGWLAWNSGDQALLPVTNPFHSGPP